MSMGEMRVKHSDTPPYHFFAPSTEQANLLVHVLNGPFQDELSELDFVESKPFQMEDDFFHA